MPTKLFVSYSRSDQDNVVRFVRFLRGNFDVDVFVDLEVEPGGDWPSKLASWLTACDVVLVWGTMSGVRSGEVNTEVGRAAEAGRRIVPIWVGSESLALSTNVLRQAHGVPLSGSESPEEVALSIGAQLELPPLASCDPIDQLLVEAAEVFDDCARSKMPGLSHLRARVAAAHRRWRDRRFQVAVIALVKAGKSTTINAWIGRELLPVSNVPETARVVVIRHDPSATEGVLADGGAEYRTPDLIRARLTALNSESRTTVEEPPDLILTTRVDALLHGKGGRVGTTPRVEITDTPGRNEAGAAHLAVRADAIVSSADAIVYVLDYTRLNTTDEAAFFEAIKSNRADVLRDWHQKIFFLVNKIDQRGHHDKSPEETRDYVSRVLTRHLGISVPAAHVHTVSAEQAVLARQFLGGALSPGRRMDFAKHVAGRWAESVSDDQLRAEAPKVLAESGLPAAEGAIMDFISSHAENLLAVSVTDQVSRELTALDNLLAMKGKLIQTEHAELVRRAAHLKQRLTAARRRLQEVDDLAQERSRALKSWTEKSFRRFKARLDDQLDDLAGTRSTGFVSRAFENARDFVVASTNLVVGGDTQGAVLAMLDALVAWALDEFATFRIDLEREAHKQQHALIGQLQSVCTAISEEIDREVGSALDIAFVPVPIELPHPTRLQLHDGIEGEIGRIVATTVRNETARIQESFQTAGFCGTPVWQQRYRDQIREVREHRLVRSKLADFVRERFHQAFQESEASAVAITGRMVRQHLAAARAAIEEHAARYEATLASRIRTADGDAQVRAVDLQAVESQRAVLARMLGDLERRHQV